MAIRNNIPFRYECNSSFVRPPELVEARKRYRNEEITMAELSSAEDKAVMALVDKEIELGLNAVTDGDYRRSFWNLDFAWELKGLERLEDRDGYRSSLLNNSATRVTDRITYDPCNKILEDYKFLYRYTGDRALAKIDIPSPPQIIVELARTSGNNGVKNVYGNDRECLYEDIITAYIAMIRDLYSAGCRSLQMSDCAWCYLCSLDWIEMAESTLGITAGEITERWLYLTNAVLEAVPEDMSTVEHICSGPYYYEWQMLKGYTRIADSVLPKLGFDGLQLKFDAGPLDIIRSIPDDKIISMGLIDCYLNVSDDRDYIVKSIRKAAKYHPLENLTLSPSCGFEPVMSDAFYGEEKQWEKIELMKSIAEEIWG